MEPLDVINGTLNGRDLHAVERPTSLGEFRFADGQCLRLYSVEALRVRAQSRIAVAPDRGDDLRDQGGNICARVLRRAL